MVAQSTPPMEDDISVDGGLDTTTFLPAPLASQGRNTQTSDWTQNDVDEDGPACQACRKRKRKCTRSQPCFHCAKLGVECSYDDTRSKPGIKQGVIEALTQRITNLERMFLGQCMLIRQLSDPSTGQPLSIRKSATGKDAQQDGGSLETQVQNLKDDLLNLCNTAIGGDEIADTTLTNALGTKKRKRDSNTGVEDLKDHQTPTRGADTSATATSPSSAKDESKKDLPSPTLSHGQPSVAHLPPNDELYDLIDLYFKIIHPWIPILHQATFIHKAHDPAEREAVATVLHAIVVATMRFSSYYNKADMTVMEDTIRACRHHVIMLSMEMFSVENLQALVIIAFDTIGSGKGPRSWAIVDSMTRTVEHLELSFEDSDDEETGRPQNPMQKENSSSRKKYWYRRGNKMIRRMAFLAKPKSWTESEERRRLFWNVFLLDRFCSVSTGWNPSIKSVDMHRRLPCEGSIWEAETPVVTRYFGMGDVSQDSSGEVNINSSTTHPPSNFVPIGTNGYSAKQGNYTEETASLGAFAYCIEATEYLSQITQFFLQQNVDPNNVENLAHWLFQFRELDLRLVQWKRSLPRQWQEATVHETEPRMDPNLTLAHITHNTSVILLHQFMAYPTATWKYNSMRSSQFTSAETCLSAAREIYTITHKYLTYNSGITNPQFAFCLFIAGRALLARSFFYQQELIPEYHHIVQCLLDLSRRWQGCEDSSLHRRHECGDDLALRFGRNLLRAEAHAGELKTRVDIQQPVYSIDSEQDDANAPDIEETQCSPSRRTSPNSWNSSHPDHMPSTLAVNANRTQLQNGGNGGISLNLEPGPESLSFASPPLPLSFEADSSIYGNTSQPYFMPAPEPSLGTPNSAPLGPSSRIGPLDSGTDMTVKQLEAIANAFGDPSFLQLDRVLIFGDDRNPMTEYNGSQHVPI
ncbi:fungal-specific transcription factor domain-containing protein [Lipomyces doorenjongii]|uniref:fungal-specific transcription factor domain-containing protein n=1 Tax=Lipomyces doorenjongii TaxID=383834 RepID=UPI0034CFE489